MIDSGYLEAIFYIKSGPCEVGPRERACPLKGAGWLCGPVAAQRGVSAPPPGALLEQLQLGTYSEPFLPFISSAHMRQKLPATANRGGGIDPPCLPGAVLPSWPGSQVVMQARLGCPLGQDLENKAFCLVVTIDVLIALVWGYGTFHI